MEQEIKQNKRSGETKVTSVSVSTKFVKFIEVYNLSPTDIFRKGLAVSLAEMGIHPYDNPLNKKRIDQVQKYIKNDRTKEIMDSIIEIGNNLSSVRDEVFEDDPKSN